MPAEQATDSNGRVYAMPDTNGKQVKQKVGLNRSILASGWSGLEHKLAYKAVTC